MKVVNESEIEKITCPGCKANIELERKQPTHRIIDIEQETPANIQAIIHKELEALKPKEPEEKPKKEEIILQSHVPGYRCGPDCQKIHKNKGYKAKVKGKCNNCDQFSNVDKGACPWCEDGEIEKIEEEELEGLKIRKPDVHEHGDE